MQAPSGYRVVRLANGTCSVRCLGAQETFHPVIGPAAEAECLYVRQLQLAERMRNPRGELVIWDVGLGAAANAVAAIRATNGAVGHVHLISFDHTLEPLEFGLQHADTLGYFNEYQSQVKQLLAAGRVEFQEGKRTVRWEVRCEDFPRLLERWVINREPARSGRAADLGQSGAESDGMPFAPDAILYDAFSPARNAEMWTLPLFRNLFRLLSPERPCALATYSRSTMLRATLLLAGFYVGAGLATGEKEETTLAANRRELIAQPLSHAWLQRARRSTSGEPLHDPHYRQAPLSPASWELLQEHPQFS